MKIAMIGGSGFVGTAMRQVLKSRNCGHEIKVIDINEPKDKWHDGFAEASVLDERALENALKEIDALMYLAMVPQSQWQSSNAQLEINETGLSNALCAARAAGVQKAVYASTLNVYDDWSKKEKYFSEDNPPPDAQFIHDPYGYTKIFGEAICKSHSDNGMTVTALRLSGPRPDKETDDLPSSHKLNWEADAREGYTYNTAITDVAAAAILSLNRTDPGFRVYFATGDYEERKLNQSRIKDGLGWFPRARLNKGGKIYFIDKEGLKRALS